MKSLVSRKKTCCLFIVSLFLLGGTDFWKIAVWGNEKIPLWGDNKNLWENIVWGARVKISRFVFLTLKCIFQQSEHLRENLKNLLERAKALSSL